MLQQATGCWNVRFPRMHLIFWWVGRVLERLWILLRLKRFDKFCGTFFLDFFLFYSLENKCTGFWSSKIFFRLFCSSIPVRFRKIKISFALRNRIENPGKAIWWGRVWQFCLSLAISQLEWRRGERASNCRSKAVVVSNGQPQPQPEEHTSQDWHLKSNLQGPRSKP